MIAIPTMIVIIQVFMVLPFPFFRFFRNRRTGNNPSAALYIKARRTGGMLALRRRRGSPPPSRRPPHEQVEIDHDGGSDAGN